MMNSHSLRVVHPTTTNALTVRDVISAYRQHCEANGIHGAEASRERRHTFREFLASFGDYLVTDCKAYLLSDWIDARPSWRSISTKRGKANQIRAAFNWAVETERIDRNPFSRVRYAEAERRPEMPDDLLNVIARVASKPFERAIRFLRLTGCRAGELCRATWTQFDLDRGLWIIQRHKTRRYTQRPKIVALVADAVALLRLMQSDPPTLFPIQPSDFVFLNTAGRPWTRQTLAKTLVRIKSKYKLNSPATIHSIRHAAASAMIANGAPIALVAEQLGHASVTTTQRFYWHPGTQYVEQMRAAVQLGLPK